MTHRRQFLLTGLFLIIALGMIAARPVVEPLAAAPPDQPFLPRYHTTDLGTLGGAKSVAGGLDELGRVVGYSDTAAGAVDAFLWDQGKMQDLGTLGGDRSGAVAINASGQVLGYSKALDGKSRVFLWRDGHFQD